MKTQISMAIVLTFAMSACADIVPPVRWDVETGRMEPRPYTLAIRRGENVKIEPRFLTYNVPMSLTNAAVEMRYSAAYSSDTFYSVSGTLQAETGRVQIAWSDALNPTNSSMVYEIRATVGTNVLARAFGSLYLLGGMVGLNTGLTARTSINWSTVAQSGGVAVLTNQMGSGAVWNGTQWTFGAGSVDLSFTNLYYRASNPSNYCTLAAAAWLTNGLSGTNHLHAGVYQPAGVYVVSVVTGAVYSVVTNGSLVTVTVPATSGGSYTETDPVWAAASGSVVRVVSYSPAEPIIDWGGGGLLAAQLYPYDLDGYVAHRPFFQSVNEGGTGYITNALTLMQYGGITYFARVKPNGSGEGNFVRLFDTESPPTAAQVGAVATSGVTSIIYSNAALFELAGTAAGLTSGLPYGVSASTASNITRGVLGGETNGWTVTAHGGLWSKGDSVTNADLTTSTGLLPDGSLGTNSTRTVSNLTVKAAATVGTLNGLTPSTILTNIPAVITPVTLAIDAGNTATVQNVFYNDLGILAANITVVIGPTMTNLAQARSFWLDWSNTTYSITFPVGSFSNVTANTATTNKAWSSYWHAGKGQTIFTGGWR